MIKRAFTELLTGAVLLGAGVALTEFVTPDGPTGVALVKTATVLWAAGVACVLDAIVRPDQPPSRVLIGLIVLAFAVSW